MTLTPVETIFIIFSIISFILSLYITYKCHKDREKYKVKIHPYDLKTATDNLPA